MFRSSKAIVFGLITVLSSCTPRIPADAFQLRPESLQLRQLQTRRFETKDEQQLLSAAAALLQDIGFQIDESETDLGVIVGSKGTDARDAGQIASAIVVAALTGVSMAIDKEQRIRASLVTRRIKNGQVNLRVTLQRIVWNSRGVISRVESVEDPELYKGFFEKLSKAVFLEAHEI